MTERKRILIVEDEPVGQIVITEMMKRLGYPADVAGSGKEALARVETQGYELIFMDCQMPEMDGFETTQRIREIEVQQQRHSKAIIIALTAKAMSGDREKCLNAGMDDYLSKPVDFEKLNSVLTSYLPPADPSS